MREFDFDAVTRRNGRWAMVSALLADGFKVPYPNLVASMGLVIPSERIGGSHFPARVAYWMPRNWLVDDKVKPRTTPSEGWEYSITVDIPNLQ